jgi:hypothetical protein
MKVLVLSMQGSPRIVGFDTMVASALVLRGHSVSMMGCGLALPACDCSDLTVMPKFGTACQDPRPSQVARNVAYNLPVLRRYLQPNDFSDAQSWAEKEAKGKVKRAMGATCDGIALGRMAYSSWRNFWRSVMPKSLTQPSPSLFDFLVSTKILLTVWKRALEELEPDLIFTLNGLYPRQAIPCQLMAQAGKRFVCYDIIGSRFHLHQNQGAPLLHQDEAWDTVNVSGEELEWAKQEIEREREQPGASFNEDYLAGESRISDWDWIRTTYGIDYRPTVAWFSNVAYDSGVVGYPTGYQDLHEIVTDTIDWFRVRPEYQLVIQMHPNERNDPAMTQKGETLTSYLDYHYPAGLPGNVKIIPAASNADPFTIAGHSLISVTWTSSLTWQLAYWGFPVIVAGWAACSDHVGYVARTKYHYWQLLEKALDGKLRAHSQWRDWVLRYKAIVEGRCWISMDHLIGAGDVNDFVPQWQGGWVALKPGMDATLDMICDCIENGEPFYWPR